MDDVETTIVTLTVGDNTNTTHVTTTSSHGDNTSVETDKVNDLAGGNVDLHGVVNLDGRVGVADTIYEYTISKDCTNVQDFLLSPARGKFSKFVSSSADQPKLGPTTE